MISIVMFFIIITVTVFFLVRANGDEVREARVMRAFFTSLASVSTALALLALVGGAPAHITVTTIVVTGLIGWFAILANRDYVAKRTASNEVLDLVDSASTGLRRAIAAGSCTPVGLLSMSLSPKRDITTTLGVFWRRGEEYVVGYEGAPTLITNEEGEEEEFFHPSQLRVAHNWLW